MDCRVIRIWAIVAGLLLLFSCEKPGEEVVFQAALSPERQTGPARQGDVVFTVTSSEPWRISCSAPWCKPVQRVGGPTTSKGTAVSVRLEDNEGLERSCEVSLFVGEEKVASAVLVQGVDEAGLALEQLRYSLPSNPGRLEIPYHSGSAVSVEPLCPWISVYEVAPNKIKLDIETYSSLVKRTGQVRVSSSNGLERTLEITQGEGFSDSQMFDYLIRLYDSDRDGTLSKEEAAAVTKMNLMASLNEYSENGAYTIYSHNIRVLDGFDYFPNLRELTVTADGGGVIRKQLYVDGHPSLTTLVIDGTGADMSLISASNCPNLEVVTVKNGLNMKQVDVSECPNLRTLHLVNGTIGYASDDLSSLILTGSPHIVDFKLEGAEFTEEPDFGLLEDVVNVSFSRVFGVRCLDLSKSLSLESLSWFDMSSLRHENRYVLLPSSRESMIQTACDENIELRYL